MGGRIPSMPPEAAAVLIAWETTWLMLSPFVYLAIYSGSSGWRRFSRAAPVAARARARFAFSLLPIALVYNITHYYTLVLTQGLKIVSLFVRSVRLGLEPVRHARLLRAPILPDMSWSGTPRSG